MILSAHATYLRGFTIVLQGVPFIVSLSTELSRYVPHVRDTYAVLSDTLYIKLNKLILSGISSILVVH
jgi:hypothetical protein